MNRLWISLLLFLLVTWKEAVLGAPVRNQTAEALERLLELLGMEGTVPQPENHPSHPPQYMLDLYRSFAEGKSHYGANTVRSFHAKKSEENVNHFYFDLRKGIPQHENMVEAQFHFFTTHHIRRLHQDPHVFQIQLFEGSSNSSSKLLETRMVSAHSLGWEVFKITAPVKKWIRHENFNKGLTVQVLDLSGREWSDHRVHRLQSYRQPILVVFSSDPKAITNRPAHSKQTASVSLQGASRSARAATAPYESPVGECSRHPLRVDFEALGWSSWIISPRFYEAWACGGSCDFPLGQHQRPSNHAAVQSVAHALGAAPNPPCCVPTELKTLSLLYFDEHMNVVLKQYDDMIAAECGCQ